MALSDAQNQLQLLRVDDEFDGDVRLEEPMAKHTTYRIGGPVRAWVQCDSLGALDRVLQICERGGLPWCVVGMGANLLVADAGYDGVAVKLGRDFKKWHYATTARQFHAGAGVMLARIVQEAFHLGVSGFEFGVGTPGTLGGALTMNAGKPDDGIGSRVVSLSTYSVREGIKHYRGDQISWGYRHSSIPSDEVVRDCVLQAKEGDKDKIRALMDQTLATRKRVQPLSAHCCGSVFKNPEGESAGRLIEACGLKGRRAGGARISTKHANFIVNEGGATADDVLALIRLAQREVKERNGIELQPEVRFLGFQE